MIWGHEVEVGLLGVKDVCDSEVLQGLDHVDVRFDSKARNAYVYFFVLEQKYA